VSLCVKKILYPLFHLLSILLLAGCNSNAPQYAEINGLTQGTTYHIVVETSPGLDVSAVRQDIETLLKKVDYSLSIYNDTSVISLINKNISDRTDALFRNVFHISAEVWEQSDGLFDLTVGPLVKSWGFGPDAIKRFDEARLDSLLSLVGMEKVMLEGDRIIKADEDIFIDMNAVAQGYTVDLVIELLDSLEISDCLVEVGGEVRTLGDKGGKGWRIGIDRPTDGNFEPGADLKAVVRLDGLSLATSGNYRRFYIDNGVKYSHTIDPRTGYPVRHTLLSATIVAPTCAVADAWATACMVAGKDTAISLVKRYDFLEAYLIWSDDKGEMKSWMSEGLAMRIEEN
jgi:thiamine biosynthesis lipoprotein